MKNRSLQKLVATALLCCLSMAHASPAIPNLVQLKNKDGQSFNAKIKGDEWFSWVETTDGYIALKNNKSGDYEFAQIKNGELVPSGTKTIGNKSIAAATTTMPAGLLKKDAVEFQSFLKNRQQPAQTNSKKALAAVSGSISASASTGPIISGQGHDHGARSVWNDLKAPPASIPLLVVILEFNDQQLRSPVSTWHDKMFGTNPGQMNYFWKSVSNNKFQFTPAQETQGTANDGIMKVRLAMNHPNLGQAIGTTERYMALDQLDGFINYAAYDTNGDRSLSKEELQIIYIYSGGESASGSSLPSVWAHKTADFGVIHDGVSFDNNYSRFGERQFSPPDDHDATFGVIAHELGHAAFNLPDLYDYDGTSGGIDSFCLMSGGSWGSGNNEFQGASPSAPSAWVRYRLGFTDATTITGSTALTQTLKPQSHQGSMVLIPGNEDQEYFLVENRYPDGTDISLGNQGMGGAMIWHIDESVYQNTDDARRLVDYENNPAVFQAFWPATGMTVFNGTSTPNSKDNSNVATGVSVSSITRLSDADHSVSFTVQKQTPTTYPSMNFRGTANNWIATPMTAIAPGVWETVQKFAVGTVNPRFKFDVYGNWATNFGDTNNDGALEQGGGDILMTPGNYSIRFYESTMRWGFTAVNQAPIANAGPDQVVFVDQNFTIDGSASVDPDGTLVNTNFKWNIGLTGPKFTMTYSTVGIRIITLTVTDSNGATSSDDLIIDVRAKPANQLPTARIVTPTTATVGQAVVFDGSTSSDPDGTIASYQWTVSGSVGTLSGAKPSYTFAAPGTYIVTLVVTDNLGGQSTSVASTINVGTAAFKQSYPQVYYRGTTNNWLTDQKMSLVGDNLWSTTVIAPATGTQTFKFDIYANWATNFGDNNADGLAEQSGGNITLPAGGGTFVITFNDLTRRYTVSKQTGGNQLPIAVVPANQTITGTATISLDGSASSDPDGQIVSYQWSQVSGTALTISNPTAAKASVVLPTVTTATSYRFRLVVTDNSSATATAEFVVTQNPVQACTPVYAKMGLRGTSNNWANTAMTLAADCFWETTAVFGSTTTERFKFDVNADWVTNFGDTNKDGIAESAGSDIAISQGAGTYLIRFNDSNKRYTIVKQ